MGAGRAGRQAVFLDRDGILNRLVPDQAAGRAESPLAADEVELADGAADGVCRLRAAGFLAVCVTNQPAAAKGRVSADQLLEVHRRVLELLARQGAYLDSWRICLHHPDGRVAALRRTCRYRKPAPGMLLAAADQLAIDLTRSVLVGDADRDVAAGQSAGCRTILVEEPLSAHRRGAVVEPDSRAGTFAEAVAHILCPRQLA